MKWGLVSVFIMGDTSDTNDMSDKYVRLPVFVLLLTIISGSGTGKTALSRVTKTTGYGIPVAMVFIPYQDLNHFWDFFEICSSFQASAWYVPVSGYF